MCQLQVCCASPVEGINIHASTGVMGQSEIVHKKTESARNAKWKAAWQRAKIEGVRQEEAEPLRMRCASEAAD